MKNAEGGCTTIFTGSTLRCTASGSMEGCRGGKRTAVVDRDSRPRCRVVDLTPQPAKN